MHTDTYNLQQTNSTAMQKYVMEGEGAEEGPGEGAQLPSSPLAAALAS